MSRTRLFSLVTAVLASSVMGPSPAAVTADDDDDDHHRQRSFSARLRSFHEVPSISSPAEGTFRARLNSEGTSLHYKLSFSGLTAPVTQSHIHFGQRHTSGGIMVWLCSGTIVDPLKLAPACPNEGSVEGDLTAANIVQPGTAPPLGQGIAAGEFEEFVRALREDAGYANVHTTNFPGGEIRGQVQ